MSKSIRYGFNTKIVPLKTPVDMAATAAASSWLDAKNALWVRFFLFFGNIAAASADQAVVVTFEAATAAASGSEVAIGGNYRLSGAVATDTWGAITSFTSTGISVATTDDNKILAVDFNPASLDGLLADGRFLRAVITPDAGGSATVVGVWAEVEPAYPQLSHLSAS